MNSGKVGVYFKYNDLENTLKKRKQRKEISSPGTSHPFDGYVDTGYHMKGYSE